MTIGSLFSGIGGLELGLEWAGLGPTLFQVEREPFAQQVLARHWPNAVRFDDVCAVGAHNLPAVDLLCGGFPCQDLSLAGRGAGLGGERSGLWREFARIIRELRPRFVVVENVAALLGRGMGAVLGDLAALGYDAEWSCVSACAVGAPHMRDRLFVVAYADKVGRQAGLHPMPHRAGLPNWKAAQGKPQWVEVVRWVGEVVSDCDRAPSDAALRRVDDGVSDRLDRLAALGNAVVPAVGYVVGCVVRQIAEAA